jgi:hypothetical protein
MSGTDEKAHAPDEGHNSSSYQPPTITRLGTVADLTRKTAGAADGATFLGLDIGSL